MPLPPASPIRIAHFEGDDAAWGRQHGEAFRDGCESGMPRFYAEFWHRLKQDGALSRRLALAGVERSLVPLFLRGMSEAGKTRIRGMSQGAGIPENELRLAAVLPDLLPWLQAWGIRLRPSRFTEARPPMFGCSSFLKKDGDLVHGRNLDFPGVNYWDRFPVIEVVSRPGKLKLINITTAGAPFPITAINEAGVGISLHQHYGLRTSIGGKLPFVIADEVLSQAKSFAEARDALLQCSVATSWAFIVYDGNEGAILEAIPGEKGVRPLAEEPLAHTNFFQTEACRPSEYASSDKMNWDNHCRHDRLLELVKGAQKGDSASLVAALGDHYDPYWKSEKVANRTVSQVYNIQSVLVVPNTGKLMVAVGDSPVHLGDYHQWDMGELFAGKSPTPEATFPGYRFKDPAKAVAKRTFVESFVGSMDGSWDAAEQSLERCMEAAFFPEAGHVAGVLKLKLGDPKSARDYFEKTMEWVDAQRGDSPPPPEYFESALYRARAEDIAGNRQEAKRLYRWLTDHKHLPEGVVQRAAKKAGPFTQRQVDNLLLPYATYIPFQ